MKCDEREGSRMTKLLIKSPGKGDGDVSANSPDVMASGIYAQNFPNFAGNKSNWDKGVACTVLWKHCFVYRRTPTVSCGS